MPTAASSLSSPELLAPAGDWEALRAAVANGADAVYFGLANFNARHRATNFTRAELPEVMEFLHRRNVRGYVTLNTLIFSDELNEVVDLAAGLVAARVDAVILQDLGLAALLHRLAPRLRLHGSTQMTLTEPRGIDFVAGLGIERVIVARELSLSDIEKISAKTRVPLEVFVHGALCVAYSGQCLTSEALGGRSANRGQCAQACRLPYELFVDGKRFELGDQAYLLSPQDLAAHDLVADLARVGVASLKIEGRLKSPQYVAMTTRTYRAALSAAAAGRPWSLSAAEQADLAQSYSRGFTHGFLSGVNHQVLVEGRFPKSRGVRLGKLVGLTRQGVVVELESHLNATAVKPGDGLVFDEGHPEQDEQGGRVYHVALHSGSPVGAAGSTQLEIEFGTGAINRAALARGALVWKTDD
ncbi:MAG: U32 family peptidase, partial [Planctomycetaceae bacterium]|nr:U32 family peptidase [Planctomycetaceae bacterium]